MFDVLQTLEKCKERLEYLDAKVENIRRLSSDYRDLSPPPPPPSSPAVLESSNMTGGRTDPRCHECHGPIAEYHAKYPHGMGKCPLQHYDLCPGDISEGKDKGGHLWRGCPDSYGPPVLDNKENNTDSDNSLDKTDSTVESDHLKTLFENQLHPKVDLPKAPLDKPDQVAPAGESEDDRILEEELAALAIAEERFKKLKLVRERKQQLQDDYDRFARQSRGEGAVSKLRMQDTLDDMRSENHIGQRSRREASNYRGPVMDEIRKDSSTKDRVDVLMEEPERIPALSNAANVPRRGQPMLKTAAPVLSSDTGGQSGLRHRPENRSDHRSQADRDRYREPLYRWETGVDRYGVEFKTLVEVTPVKTTAPAKNILPMDDGWVFDHELGRAYKRTVLSQERYRPSSTPPRPARAVFRSPTRVQRARSGTDWEHSRVPLENHYPTEREGKPTTVVDHAKQLPLQCSQSVTSKNINFAMFMYGAIKELHSARIGTSPPLEPGMLEAKLQHLLNVVHVTCLNMGTAEFKPASWSVGRTYHYLVQAKVDSGRESYLDFDQLHRGSPHASEMVAAEREHRVALANQLKPKQEDKVKKRGDDKKPLCPTWNSSEVEGKCKWESEHPDTKCNRAHYCSYCEKKSGHTRTNHQEKYCKRKLDDDK